MSEYTKEPWPDGASASYVKERLCKLMAWAVQHSGGFQFASDCFCGQGGYWWSDQYGGTFEDGYRNEGKAVMWIESAAHACAGMSDPEARIAALRACEQEQGQFLVEMVRERDALRAERDAIASALEQLIEVAQECDSWESFPSGPLERACAALARSQK